MSPLGSLTCGFAVASHRVVARFVSSICRFPASSRPYDERRAWATCRKMWPDVDVVCASQQISFDDYLEVIGDDRLVIDILVGDVQRIIEYPKAGFTLAQDVPPNVGRAYDRLRRDKFTSRLIRQ